MALIDNAVLTIGAGNYFYAPVGTEAPTDLRSPGVEWENMGHTSLEDIMSIESEGGEPTILGTLQKRKLRSRYSDRTDTFAVNLQQFDRKSLKFYYGSNSQTLANGMQTVENDAKPTEVAFLAVFIDTDNVFAFYCPKAEVFRGDNLELENVEDLVSLPLSVTPINHSTNSWTYAVTPIGDGLLAPAWAAETDYEVGEEVSLTGGEILEATVAGTSGTTEPTAPATVGGTVTDGDVEWVRVL